MIASNISIVIPVYNEAENVIPLCEEIIIALQDFSGQYEILFVNDGSQDITAQHLSLLEQKYEVVRSVSHQCNVGQSIAICTGAKMAQYPVLVLLDGDGQNDPADIQPMLMHFTNVNTAVLGYRKTREDNIVKKCSSRIGNHIRRWILQDDCLDTGCSLKVFGKDAFLNLPHFNHMHRFLPALFKRAGLELKMVAVNHRARQYGVSKYGVVNRLLVGIYDLIGVRWLMKRSCQVKIL